MLIFVKLLVLSVCVGLNLGAATQYVVTGYLTTIYKAPVPLLTHPQPQVVVQQPAPIAQIPLLQQTLIQPVQPAAPIPVLQQPLPQQPVVPSQPLPSQPVSPPQQSQQPSFPPQQPQQPSFPPQQPSPVAQQPHPAPPPPAEVAADPSDTVEVENPEFRSSNGPNPPNAPPSAYPVYARQ